MKKITPDKFKIILVGSLGVGKTSLVNKITTVKELNEPLASIYTHSAMVGGSKVELDIWDTLGQEKSGKISPSYYRDAQGAIIVFDVTDDRSYIEVDHWIQSVKFLAGEIPLIIVGNKCEIYRRKILTGRASDKAIHYAASYVETSVKQNIKITDLFAEMARRCLNAPPDDLELEKEVVEEMTPVMEELAGTIVELQSEEITELTQPVENSEMSITSVVPFSEPSSAEATSKEVEITNNQIIPEKQSLAESTETVPKETEITEEPSDFASQEPVGFTTDVPVEFASEESVDFADDPVEFASEEPVEEAEPQINASSVTVIPTEVHEKIAEEPQEEIETKDIFEDLPEKSEHWEQIQQKIESVSSSFTEESDDSDTIPKISTEKMKTGLINQDELAQRILKKVTTIKQIEKSDEVKTPTKQIPRIIPIEQIDSTTEKTPISKPLSEIQDKQSHRSTSEIAQDPLAPRDGETIDIEIAEDPLAPRDGETIDIEIAEDPLTPRDGEIIDIDIIDETESSVPKQQVTIGEKKPTSDPYFKNDLPPSPPVTPSSEMSFSNYKDEKASQMVKNLKKDGGIDKTINEFSPSSVIGRIDTAEKTEVPIQSPIVGKPNSSFAIPSTTPIKTSDPSPTEKTEEETSSLDKKDTKSKKSFIPKP